MYEVLWQACMRPWCYGSLHAVPFPHHGPKICHAVCIHWSHRSNSANTCIAPGMLPQVGREGCARIRKSPASVISRHTPILRNPTPTFGSQSKNHTHRPLALANPTVNPEWTSQHDQLRILITIALNKWNIQIKTRFKAWSELYPGFQ